MINPGNRNVFVEFLSKVQIFLSHCCQFGLRLVKLASCFSESFEGCFIDFPNTDGNALIENEINLDEKIEKQ